MFKRRNESRYRRLKGLREKIICRLCNVRRNHKVQDRLPLNIQGRAIEKLQFNGSNTGMRGPRTKPPRGRHDVSDAVHYNIILFIGCDVWGGLKSTAATEIVCHSPAVALSTASALSLKAQKDESHDGLSLYTI